MFAMENNTLPNNFINKILNKGICSFINDINEYTGCYKTCVTNFEGGRFDSKYAEKS